MDKKKDFKSSFAMTNVERREMALKIAQHSTLSFDEAFSLLKNGQTSDERLQRDEEFTASKKQLLEKRKFSRFYSCSLWAQGRKKSFTFDDWKPEMQSDSERAAAIGNKAFRLAKELEQQDFNVLLTGSVGAGKTALALAISDKLRNFKTTLFVSMVEWKNLRMGAIKSPEKQREFSRLEQMMKDAEVLLLDDLGKDNKDSNGRATQDTNNMLFGLGDARMGKTTIITTNDSQSELARKYDAAVVSRLITKNPDHTISTNGLQDVREV
ncbi:AAA family ATPase [Weissella viridescens]|uniref:AAA family ATPase n=1 Tax=Weissella viridescens TaxID=1629 RepID=A0A3P2RCA5_WEIVI|nr:ATP-binding protein [Weissella viridescens]RRG18243.1 AAA family ATPase [Weissella viridescens]